MNTLEELESRVRELERQSGRVREELRRAQGELRDHRSREFITLMGITRDQVLDRDAPGIPFFGTIHKFVDWLKRVPPEHRRKYVTWNTQLYLTIAILSGDFSGTPAYYEDVPK